MINEEQDQKHFLAEALGTLRRSKELDYSYLP